LNDLAEVTCSSPRAFGPASLDPFSVFKHRSIDMSGAERPVWLPALVFAFAAPLVNLCHLMNANQRTSVPAMETRVLRLWAIIATLVAIVSTGFALFFFLQARSRLPLAPAESGAVDSPFLTLPDSALPGPYKWISKSGSESIITLNDDHTFSKDGTTNPQHRWEIARDALVIFWLRNHNRLNKMERPGVYVEMRDGVETARMEKQE
jgi:hypothetical protein